MIHWHQRKRMMHLQLVHAPLHLSMIVICCERTWNVIVRGCPAFSDYCDLMMAFDDRKFFFVVCESLWNLSIWIERKQTIKFATLFSTLLKAKNLKHNLKSISITLTKRINGFKNELLSLQQELNEQSNAAIKWTLSECCKSHSKSLNN